MRPVNLIPPDLRRGDNAPLRTGPLPYIVVGALALVLVGVTLLVLTNNQISDRQAEVVKLRHEDNAAKAKAQRLAAYTEFRTMTEQRVATVSELANSRFDWERVMRELSLVLPRNVWLTELAASAAPGAGEGGSGESSVGGINGPSLEMSGCATGQDAVAGFVAALKDIEGVTRVGLQSSSVGGGGEGTASGGEGCQARDFIAQFKLVVAFDAAPTPITGESGEVVAETTSTESTEGSEGSESSPATSEGETSTESAGG
ncbi:MAG TPA: PilN domain-containing protein [Solirubrobacterales bacterium]|jgi:Tfp pilus assembly protein PilN